MENMCICCGEIIPEGRQICPECEKGRREKSMTKISPEKYVEGVNSIYIEQPAYDKGCDGSNGKCDCIGMGRGALIREGIPKEEIIGMNGTNYALRHTFINVQKIQNEKQLKKGDIVLKTRDKDDKSMRLPDQYRKGGLDYSEKWGETNCTHYGSVTKEYPDLEITHMNSPSAKKDYSLGNWSLFGQLPWIDYSGQEDPQIQWARVYAENGKPVKMRLKPSLTCRTWWEVPNGSEVVLVTPGEKWSEIIWAGRTGYMKSEFIRTGEARYTVVTKDLTKEQAEDLIKMYGGTMTAEG